MSMKKQAKPPSKQHPSSDPLPKRPFPFFFPPFLFFSFTLLWLTGCGPQGKGEPCTRDNECQSAFKCLHARCADGLADSPCLSDDDCQTSLLFRCNPQGTCQISKPHPEENQPDQEQSPPDSDEPAKEQPPQEPSPEDTSCRNSASCPPGHLCLPNADGTQSQCQLTPKPCLRPQDCPTGTPCRLIEQRDGSLSTFCTPNFQSSTPRQPAGALCQENAQCQSDLCLLPFFQRCGAFCQKDEDCPENFYCGHYSYGAQGEFSGCWPRCQSHSDCPQDYLCDPQNHCRPQASPAWGGPCTGRQDCPTEAVCLNSWPSGLCTRSCAPLLLSCDPLKPTCPAQHQCLKDPYTETFSCSPLCPDGMQCAATSPQQALCLQTCTQDSHCRSDYACGSNGLCLPRGEGEIGDTCERDQDCRSLRCRLFPNGRYCTQSCEQDCPARFFCRQEPSSPPSGWCERLCDNDQECLEKSYQCRSLRCDLSSTQALPDGSPCQQDNQCQSNLCQQGPFFPHGLCVRTCQQQNDCKQGTLCLQVQDTGRLCLPTCSDKTPCERDTYTCFPLPLQENISAARPIPCNKESTCPTPSAAFESFCARDEQQAFCAIGICLGRGALRVGSPCFGQLDCSSGLCVFPKLTPLPVVACNKDADCPQTAPLCETFTQRCVVCRAPRDCPSHAPLCRMGQCTSSGYCGSPCENNCPQNTACTPRTDGSSQSLPSACLPTCKNTFQCQLGFTCKQTQDTLTCYPTHL